MWVSAHPYLQGCRNRSGGCWTNVHAKFTSCWRLVSAYYNREAVAGHAFVELDSSADRTVESHVSLACPVDRAIVEGLRP
jgi:hypothetical protein